MLAQISESYTIGFAIHKTIDNVYKSVLINGNNEFIKWLIAVKASCASGKCGLLFEQFKTLMTLLDDPLRYTGYDIELLTAYVEGWRLLPGLEPNLYPPVMEIAKDMFVPAILRNTFNEIPMLKIKKDRIKSKISKKKMA
jgi:hypothetical protein